MKKILYTILLLIAGQAYSQGIFSADFSSEDISLYGAANMSYILNDAFFNSHTSFGPGAQIGASSVLFKTGDFSFDMSMIFAFQTSKLERHSKNINYQIKQRLYSIMPSGYVKYEGMEAVKPKLGLSGIWYVGKGYTYSIFEDKDLVYTNQSDGGLMGKINYGLYAGLEVPLTEKLSLDVGLHYLFSKAYDELSVSKDQLFTSSFGVSLKL